MTTIRLHVDHDSRRRSVVLEQGDRSARVPGFDSISDLLTLSRTELRALVTGTMAEARRESAPTGQRLAPIDGRMEVWAAGVTYERSRTAREEESRTADVYDLVYSAERPELFLKAVPWRVVTHGDPVARRRDSTNDTPEPELGLVVNRDAEIVGYVVVNDMSSRSIEGENPLYLPQAKVYTGSCAIGDGIVPSWEVVDPYCLSIEMSIVRGEEVVFRDTASTSQLARSFDELVAALFHSQSFPHGVVLSTGTCIVPPLDEPVRDGDVVTMSIEAIGTLENHVVPAGPDLDDALWARAAR